MTTTTRKPTEAWMSSDLFELGLGHVLVARFKTDGDAEIGGFLIDVFCRGVRDGFFERVDPPGYEHSLERLFTPSGRTPLSPACARRLVEDAAAYGTRFGFLPPPDFKKGCRVFGGITAAECTTTFTFGKDGRPCFVQSPKDSQAYVAQAMRRLTSLCGEGNYGFVIEQPFGKPT